MTCKVTDGLGGRCTPEHRHCATLGDCPDHMTAVLELYPPGTTVTNMSTGEMYVDLDRLEKR
jgi:hypothetical protein